MVRSTSHRRTHPSFTYGSLPCARLQTDWDYKLIVKFEDLESLKGMLSQSIGMPVEEMLERKEELMARLPAEGRPVRDLIAVSSF